MSDVNCYICNSNKIKLFKQVDVFTAYRCHHCGLIWIGDVKKTALDNFYNDNYYNSNTKIGYQDYLADELNHRTNAINLLKTVTGVRLFDSRSFLIG